MKPSTKRTLKKLFLNVTSALFAVVLTGNIIAGENAGQINQFLGTKTSKTVSTLPAGQEEGYARYFDSKFSTIAELKASCAPLLVCDVEFDAAEMFDSRHQETFRIMVTDHGPHRILFALNGFLDRILRPDAFKVNDARSQLRCTIAEEIAAMED